MFRKKSFKGGAHPHDEKHFSADMPIQYMPVPEKVIIPLQQHIGAPPDLAVEKGEHVKKGQPLANASKFVSVPVHASTSGTIVSIEKMPHPFGTKLTSIIIESDGKDEWFKEPVLDTGRRLRRLVGSNPTPTATFEATETRMVLGRRVP